MKFDNHYKKYAHIFACDEVGRGPLAGPVVSCSIYIDNQDPVKFVKWLSFLADIGVQDSKKVSAKKRSDILQQVFKQDHFVASKIYQANELVTLSATIIEIDAPMIDDINILQASLKAMRDGTEQLFHLTPEKKDSAICLIDGNQCFKSIDAALELAPIVKGDAKSLLIGLASIMAKQHRDTLMANFAKIYPQYGFDSHFGYPTLKHREALIEHGITPIHRKSYKTVKALLTEP